MKPAQPTPTINIQLDLFIAPGQAKATYKIKDGARRAAASRLRNTPKKGAAKPHA